MGVGRRESGEIETDIAQPSSDDSLRRGGGAAVIHQGAACVTPPAALATCRCIALAADVLCATFVARSSR